MNNQRFTILIVEDDPFSADYLEQELEDLGYGSLRASNGKEALAVVEVRTPDLILLDIMMPVMDGFTVLGRLKANPEKRSIPVIIISALNDMQSVVKGIEMGAEDFLPKPFEPTLMRARLMNALQKRLWQVQEQNYLREIESAKQRIDDLLHVILPDPVVCELITDNKIAPREYPDVAVLFADVADFTNYTETHNAEQVVDNLQRLVIAYENLALKWHIQKIKTIGDSFMAAGNLLEPLDNPVLNCIQCGLEMVHFALQMGVGWEVRVGIHTGPLIAGVVGKRQYLFDIWGDTVNTAQRVQSHGEISYVNLSQQAWQKVKVEYPDVARVTREVKSKGLLDIYLIRGEE
jgi:DNA-binding response OmpR family regulator